MTSTENNDKKVDRAFEVIDRLESRREKSDAAAQDSASARGKKTKHRSGLRLHFSMEALISDEDRKGLPREEGVKAGASNLLNFNITLPHVWRIPVVGPAALKIIKRIQSDNYQDSIKDILNSLRKKKPF